MLSLTDPGLQKAQLVESDIVQNYLTFGVPSESTDDEDFS